MPGRIEFSQTVYNLSIPEPNSGCWLWIGSVDKDGYSKARSTTGHKLSYLAFKGEVPIDCEIDHKCRVRCCVNPDHLEAITHAENVGRGDYKSNHRNKQKTHCKRGHPLSGSNLTIDYNGARQCITCRSERNKNKARRKNPKLLLLQPGRHHNAKISEDAILYIRGVYPKESLKTLADRFNVSKSSIWKVVKNTHYKYLLPNSPFKPDEPVS